MITTLAFENYRSLRRLVMPLSELTVVAGANGVGKSNVYRGLRLLAAAASGGHRNGMVAALAREGGLQSALWAGPQQGSVAAAAQGVAAQGTARREPVRLKVGFSTRDAENGYGYAFELGLPAPGNTGPTAFSLDPEIKAEAVFSGEPLRPATTLVSRSGPLLKSRNASGGWEVLHRYAASYESMLDLPVDPAAAPELVALARTLQGWRFYDHLRTDQDAPARRAHVGTRTPVLADGGDDLAAALQTVVEIGDNARLEDAIDDAFPGASLQIDVSRGQFDVNLKRTGLLRPLAAAELSDGTLRYLMLLAALLSPRPPALLVLNEPETSLHPELMAPLARLIVSCPAQVIVVTHNASLVRELARSEVCSVLTLESRQGETAVADLGPLDEPPWRWCSR